MAHCSWVSGGQEVEVGEPIGSPKAVQINLVDGKLYLSTNANAHFHGFTVDEAIKFPPGKSTIVSRGILRGTDFTNLIGTPSFVPDRTYYLTNVPGKIALIEDVVGNVVIAGHALTPFDLLILTTPSHTVIPLYAAVLSLADVVLPVVDNAVTVFQTSHHISASGTAPQRRLETINGGFAGSILVLSKEGLSSGNPILRDNVGNLRLAGDFELVTPDDRIMLIFDGVNWCELSRSANST